MPPPSASEDEFDAFPDPFGDVDWNTVPGLEGPSAAQTANEASFTSYEELSTNLTDPARQREATPSSHYSFDDIDDSFLAEVDGLENLLNSKEKNSDAGPSSAMARAQSPAPTQPSQTPSTSTIIGGSVESLQPEPTRLINISRYFQPPGTERTTDASHLHTGNASTLEISPAPKSPGKVAVSPKKGPHTPRKRPRHASSSPVHETSTKKQKGKQREPPDASVRRLLNEFEDEMTCPICCDIFAFAHLGNPCGHSFCGECGFNWIVKNRKAPTCAVCRAKLSADAPMIPNFAMDNTIEKHVRALGSNGDAEWIDGGSKYNEWLQRKEKWKTESAKRTAAFKPAPRNLAIAVAGYAHTSGGNAINGDHPYESSESSSSVEESDEDSDDESEEESEEESPVLPPAPVNASHLPHPHRSRPYRARGGHRQSAPSIDGAHASGNGDVPGGGRGRGGRGRGNRGYRGGRGGRGRSRRGRGQHDRGGHL
ncbi:hypothetical protein BV25DRAFT_872343 [Artomyces pyxidatus]|uniref:Uncharacterized protein n=1 Tax=Artomyces pyxidatus TaxID=48021 RepID=A0ACB8THE9_9AGAM|nr:hypothetical protein BV25DRAFT_872343 [Artomyces pyxidatus]